MKEFDYERLTFNDRDRIHNSLAETTMRHIDASAGLFSPLEFDPAKYPSQRLETVHLEPAPPKPGEPEALAEIAAPELFPFLVNRTRAYKRTLESMRQKMQDGTSVHVVVSPHLKMDDLPELSVAIGKHMDPKSWHKQNGTIISRGVTTIGAFGMAASEVIEKAGHVFLSFPRTKTMESVIDRLSEGNPEILNLIAANNRHMREAIHQWKDRSIFRKLGGKALGKSLQIAWEGSTPKLERHDDNSIKSVEVGSVSQGTLDLLKGDYVLPVMLWSDPENPALRIAPLQKIDSYDDITDIHNWQTESLADVLDIPAESISVAD